MSERAPSIADGRALRPIAIAVATTLLAAALSYALPEEHAATGVGACFLLAVYVLVLRAPDAETIRGHGLSLGGIFEPRPIAPEALGRGTLVALGWALGLALVFFPPFWLGYVYWYAPRAGFSPAAAPSLYSDVLGQLLGIAFPEEAFYRGYLQTALDKAWPPERRLFGAEVGPGVVVAGLLFAAGHYLTEPMPGRLAVFFPSLVFGYLRARTGGIGAGMAFHAMCNLFATFLGRSYGLFR